MSISFVEETITPECAKIYLENNVINRNVKPDRVNAYARDILSDKWELTHQGIAFDSKGRLIDGQHRFLAIIKANKPVNMIVSRGGQSYKNIDTGCKRSISDSNAMEGLPGIYKSKGVISSVRSYLRFKVFRHRTPLTINDVNDFIMQYSSQVECVYHTYNRFKKREKTGDIALPSYVGAAMIGALVNGESEDAIRSFAKSYCTSEIDSNYKTSSAIRTRSIISQMKSKDADTNKKMRIAQNGIYNFIHNTKKDKWDEDRYEHKNNTEEKTNEEE